MYYVGVNVMKMNNLGLIYVPLEHPSHIKTTCISQDDCNIVLMGELSTSRKVILSLILRWPSSDTLTVGS